MLENIKMLLEIPLDDTSQDNLINYYIETTKQKILNYTGQTEFPTGLDYIVEEIVYNKMNGTNPNVKVVQRGDVSIEYSQNELYPYRQELILYKTMKVI